MRFTIVSYDPTRVGGIETVANLAHSALTSACSECQLLYPNKSGQTLILALLPRLTFVFRLALALYRNDSILIIHVHFLPIVNFLRTAISSRSALICWLHGTEIWGPTNRIFDSHLARCSSLIFSSSFTQSNVPLSYPTLKTIINPPSKHSGTKATISERLKCFSAITISRLDPTDSYKGHRNIINALYRLNLKQLLPHDFVWCVVGDGQDKDYLVALCRDYQLQSQVQFMGRLTENQLSSCITRSCFHLLPSISNPNLRVPTGEGFGISYLDAGFHGLPSIAHEQGGQTDYIRHMYNGLLVDSSIQSLESSILYYLRNPGEVSRMGANALKTAQKLHSIGTFKQKLIDACFTALSDS